MNITQFSSQNLGLNNDHDNKDFIEIWENLLQSHPFLPYAASHLYSNVPHSGRPDELQAREIRAQFINKCDKGMLSYANNLLNSGVKFHELRHSPLTKLGVIFDGFMIFCPAQRR